MLFADEDEMEREICLKTPCVEGEDEIAPEIKSNRTMAHKGQCCKQKTIAANKKHALQTKNDRCKQKTCAANKKRCGYMAGINRSRFSKY